MPTTPILNLPFPEESAPADVPIDIEKLARAIEATGGLFLAGDLKASAAQAPPAGWLLCDGRAVNRTTFRALFTAIGIAYGAGDGSTTFNLPDLRGRMPLGAANAGELNARGGEREHVLSVAELAHHAHGVSDPTHAHGVADPGHLHWPASGGPFFAAVGGQWAFSGSDIPIGHGGSTGISGAGVGIYGAYTGIGIYGEGGSAAHNNMPPYVGVNFFIKT